MSPGRYARPSGMFSAAATRPMTRWGRSSFATARIAPMTAADPLMSNFMSHMPSPLLRDMPPVSKVMPLPMKMIGAALGSVPECSRMTKRGGRALPCPTALRAPMPSFEMRCSSNISQESPVSRAISKARSASVAGGKSLPGVLLRSRAKHTLSAMICPVFAPFSTSICLDVSNSTRVNVSRRLGSSLFVL